MSNPELGHHHSLNWLMTSCLVLQAFIYCAFKESILQGCFWAACFSMAPWTAPVCCFEHNSVYAVLSVQPFNGAFIRCWINGLHVLSESWCVKLWHRVLSLVLSASQNLVLTVLLLTTKADSAALSLVHLTAARVESPRVTGLPRLGHGCLKAAIQARRLGLEAARDTTLIWALWDWKHHSPAQGLLFCLLLCIYTCLPCDCKKSVSATNILIWTTLQWGTFAFRQITSYFRWVLFIEVGVCLNKAFTCLTSNLVW